MAYNLRTFLNIWRDFMDRYGNTLPTNLLAAHGFTQANQLTGVINAAVNGQLEGGLNRLADVRRCLTAIMEYKRDHFHGYDDEYDELEETMQEFEEVIDYLDPKNFGPMINLATPEEKMMVTSIIRQKSVKLPEDMEKEILGFLGKGGIKYRKTARRGKSKTARKSRRMKRAGGSRRRKSRNVKRTRSRK